MDGHDAAAGRGVVRRPTASPPSFVCNRCDFILHDGAHYELCPRCDLRVDWVDLDQPVWACPTCFRMVNSSDVLAAPRCPGCATPMRQLRSWERPGSDPRPRARGMGPVGLAVTGTLLALPLSSLALDPQWRWLALATLAPLLLLPLLVGSLLLGQILSAWRELAALARDGRTRVIHGFEHAAAHLLEAAGHGVAGGRTQSGRFCLYLEEDFNPNGGTPEDFVRRVAAEGALRIAEGERELAFHPRCGSSWLVGVVLMSLGAIVTGVTGLLAHLSPGAWALIAAATLVVPAVLTRPLGLVLQRNVTVATGFSKARVVGVSRRVVDGRVGYEVQLEVEL